LGAALRDYYYRQTFPAEKNNRETRTAQCFFATKLEKQLRLDPEETRAWLSSFDTRLQALKHFSYVKNCIKKEKQHLSVSAKSRLFASQLIMHRS